MKFLVMGTGTVGGCLGGMLARAGEEITFVARGGIWMPSGSRGCGSRARWWGLQRRFMGVWYNASGGRIAVLLLLIGGGQDGERTYKNKGKPGQ
jgi:hypothetical protein